MGVEAIRSGTHVCIDNTSLARLQEIQIKFRREPHTKFHRLERSIAPEQIRRHPEGLIYKGLFAAPEKVLAARRFGRHIAWRGEAAHFRLRQTRSGDIQEPTLSKNRYVAFKAVSVERIVPMRSNVRVLSATCISLPSR